MPKCDFNKVVLQLYWNRTSAWVVSCKFTAYFQKKLLRRTPTEGFFCVPNISASLTASTVTNLLANNCKLQLVPKFGTKGSGVSLLSTLFPINPILFFSTHIYLDCVLEFGSCSWKWRHAYLTKSFKESSFLSFCT